MRPLTLAALPLLLAGVGVRPPAHEHQRVLVDAKANAVMITAAVKHDLPAGVYDIRFTGGPGVMMGRGPGWKPCYLVFVSAHKVGVGTSGYVLSGRDAHARIDMNPGGGYLRLFVTEDWSPHDNSGHEIIAITKIR